MTRFIWVKGLLAEAVIASSIVLHLGSDGVIGTEANPDIIYGKVLRIIVWVYKFFLIFVSYCIVMYMNSLFTPISVSNIVSSRNKIWVVTYMNNFPFGLNKYKNDHRVCWNNKRNIEQDLWSYMKVIFFYLLKLMEYLRNAFFAYENHVW